MRGRLDNQATMLVALTPDQLVPQDHPIRRIKLIVDAALTDMAPTFNRMYADVGLTRSHPRSVKGMSVNRPLLHSQRASVL
jgi:hypothetical protein